MHLFAVRQFRIVRIGLSPKADIIKRNATSFISSPTSSLFKEATILFVLSAACVLKPLRWKSSPLVSLNLWTLTVCFSSVAFLLKDWLMHVQPFSQIVLVTSANAAMLPCQKSWYNLLINYGDSVIFKTSSMPICSVSRLWISEKVKSVIFFC